MEMHGAGNALDILNILLRLAARPIDVVAARVFGAVHIPVDVAARMELDGPCCCSGREGSDGEDS